MMRPSAAWPVVAWAQQTDRLRRIGVLLPGAGAKDLAAKQLAKLAARKAAKKLAKPASQAAVKPKPAPVPPTEMPEQLRDRVRAGLLRRPA